jgi:hypothetical protein
MATLSGSGSTTAAVSVRPLLFEPIPPSVNPGSELIEPARKPAFTKP